MSELAGTRVVVVGLGPMGRGIARAFDAAGADVQVVDVTPEATLAALEKTRSEAEAEQQALASTTAADLETAAPGADLVIEATVENMAVKRELLARLAQLLKPETVVASNTSSLSIGEMGQAFGDPGRVVGMHFFNPPTKMRLVEVIVAAGTSARTAERARGLVAALDKVAVTCADSPNFIVNRVCRPLYYEAQLLTTQGIEPAVVDAAATGALGHPMGPLTLLDFTGLHTHLASSETALREFGDPRYRPIPVARSLVRGGFTGRAAGRGFYDYGSEKPRVAIDRVVRKPASGAPASITPAGPDADLVSGWLTDSSAGDRITLYACRRAPTSADADAVRRLAADGAVVVDSSDGHWLELLPDGVGWVHLHRSPRERLFVEVVEDDVAGVHGPEHVDRLLDALAAPSVPVPALPGLVVDRLAHCMINEASTLVEEGIAAAQDIDTALRLGMNHPRGPFEQLELEGVGRVYGSLRSMAELVGDPRYRPSQLLRRQAAGAVRS
jgi:3-hydroxybutyryl-CoA dehydrogenase